MSSAQDLLTKGATRRVMPVEVPGIGTYHVRSLTEAERAKVERDSRSDDDQRSVLSRLIQLCACDAKGNRLFRDDAETLEQIGNLDVAVAGAFELAINKLADSSTYEETVKNFGLTTGDS